MAPDWSPTRRSFVASTALALTAGGLAGCLGRTDEDDGSTSYDLGSRLDLVPEASLFANYTHVQELLDDPATETLLDAFFRRRAASEYYSGPTSLSAAREAFDEASPVPLSGLRETMQFGSGPTGGFAPFGYLLWTDWAETDTVAAVEQLYGESLERERHEGRTLYTASEDAIGFYALGVVGDGRYVLGGREAVERVLAVAAGAPSADDALRGALQTARPGPLQFGLDVPRERLREQVAEEDRSPYETAILQLERVSGSVYRDEDTRGAELLLTATDAEAAEAVEAAVQTGLSGAREGARTGSAPREVLADTSLSTTASQTALRYETTVSELETLADRIADPPATPTPARGTMRADADEPTVRVAEATGTVTDGRVTGVTLALDDDLDADPDEVRVHLLRDDGEREGILVPEGTGEDAPDVLRPSFDGDPRIRVRFEGEGLTAPLRPGEELRLVVLGVGEPSMVTLTVPATLDGDTVALDVAVRGV